MSSDIKQQILQQTKNAKNILIVFKDIKYGSGYPAGGDSVCSALALASVLRKNGKNVDIASPNFFLPEALSSLRDAEIIKNNIRSAHQAKIRVNIKDSGIKDFSYDTDGEFLNIYFSPKEGFIDLNNLETEDGAWAYDLIFALDTSELALLGGIYAKNKALFDAVPVINIDDSAENENYGEINFVDIKSSSVAEIIWQIIKEGPNLDENIIDCVLAGIVAKTKNFRRPNISPRTLEIAGELIGLGARREELVEKFYRTKSVETLRLWGRTLARLKYEGKIVWSLLARTDFIHSGAAEEMLPDVIHELISNSPNAEVAALLFESVNGAIKTIIFSHKLNLEIEVWGIKHNPSRLTHATLPHTNLITAERELIQKIKETIN